MNCCTGNCTQGRDCPAHSLYANRECHEPQDTPRPSLLSRLRRFLFVRQEPAIKKAERELKRRPLLRSVRFWNF